MTTVEKRHSGRRGSSHRKHSDGGYSDTSSGSSFLDETDREVSSLTDRAFRSLCIGEEAVYNDLDLCSSSPSSQRERMQAFSQERPGQEWGREEERQDREERDREMLKRAAQESFSLSLEQYGQEGSWVQGGGAETLQKDLQQWGGYGEGGLSSTFQRTSTNVSQQENILTEERLSLLSNGAIDLCAQQRRSRSRVSSLIKAFSSEGYRDKDAGGLPEGKLRDWNNSEPSWDKSALMSIQRELSEFSTAYHNNFNTGPFPSSSLSGPFPTPGPFGPFSGGPIPNPTTLPFPPRETSLYSSEVAGAVAHMDTSGSSCMRAAHSKHSSMFSQLNSTSNFFMHSELSPFRVWRNQARFPFQHGDQVSGFMSPMEFPRWYETPMYKELTMGHQMQSHAMFYEQRGVRPQRKHLEAVAPPPPHRSTSTSTVLHKSLALEKLSDSELTQYPPWKRSRSVGSKHLSSHRPSTVSPTNDWSRRSSH